MYTTYVNEHESASNDLKYLRESKKYSEFNRFCLACCVNPVSKGLNLSSLLITPIQRIPRYKLLLSELIKNTPEDHPDKADLDKALTIISATAKHINDSVRCRN
jgi:hypothetical protein